MNSPDDALEQQADRMADRALRRTDNGAAGDVARALPRGAEGDRSLANTLGGEGQPLSDATRRYFEPRFHFDFSKVRIHTGERAMLSSQALGASAYTLGNDVMLGDGQLAANSRPGLDLLAHELAHVVQQSSMAAPKIQRHLLFTGNKADIASGLKLLKQDTGLDLQYDAKSHLVTLGKAGGKPKSQELASQLTTIIGDDKKDAEIEFGQAGADVMIGAFPMDKANFTQRVRIDQVLAEEKGAPGAGAAHLGHEIVENYVGHGLDPSVDRNAIFPEAHKAGIATEDKVESDLGHPGTRRTDYPAAVQVGKSWVTMWIQDNTQYFLIDQQGAPGKPFTTRRAPRVPVSSYKMDGLDATLNVDMAMIDQVAVDMNNEPSASVQFAAVASAAKSDAENLKLATKWIQLIEALLVDKASPGAPHPMDPGVMYAGRFIEESKVGTKGENFVRITLERPKL